MSTHDWRQYAPHFDDPCVDCGRSIHAHYVQGKKLKCAGPDMEKSRETSQGPWTVVDIALLRSQLGHPVSDSLRTAVNEQIEKMKEEANA